MNAALADACSAREIEATHPGGLAALDCAARDFTKQLAVDGLGDRERGLVPEGAEPQVIEDAHDLVVPALDTDDPERRSRDLNHTFDNGLHLTPWRPPKPGDR